MMMMMMNFFVSLSMDGAYHGDYNDDVDDDDGVPMMMMLTTVMTIADRSVLGETVALIRSSGQ